MATSSAPASAIVSASEKKKDWTYLVGKTPTDLHVDLADFIAEETGVPLADMDPVKLVQAVLAMHGTWQKTDRVARRRRTEASIAKGGATTATKRGYELASAPSAPVEAPAPAPATEEKATPARRRTRKAPAAK